MGRIKGFGLVLLVVVVVLLGTGWKKAQNFQKIEVGAASAQTQFAATNAAQRPLVQFFRANHRLARQGDVRAPDNLPASVKNWRLQANGVLEIDLDHGRGSMLETVRMVPVVLAKRAGFSYQIAGKLPADLLSLYGGVEFLSNADIDQQLRLNDERLRDATAEPGTSARSSGRVLLWPADAPSFKCDAGSCQQERACINARPLLCHATTFSPQGTMTDYRGTHISSLADADAMCAGTFGPQWRLLRINGISSGSVPSGNGSQREYWVHDEGKTSVNCWASS